jgi:hypothetical protein
VRTATGAVPLEKGSFMPLRSRRTAAALLGAVTIVGATFAFTGGVGAAPPYDPDDHTNTSTATSIPPGHTVTCKHADGRWSDMPRVLIHTGEYVGSASEDDMVEAVSQVNAQIRAMGATSARVTRTDMTTARFHYHDTYDDLVPTIHVGFIPRFPDEDNDPGTTTLAATDPDIPGGPCETQIAVQTDRAWNYGTPLAGGEVPSDPTENMYYDAGRGDGTGTDYFRISYLHELLHAFNLPHTDTGFAFMNYGERPWRRGPSGDAARPLPDDVEHIRALYPASGDAYDVGLLNTYYDPTRTNGDTKNPAAKQFMLCGPSTGTGFADDKFAPRCGVDAKGNSGSPVVCAGDTLYTRVAISNYSTEAVDVTVRYWLSTDDRWDATDDFESATTPAPVNVSRTGSKILADHWKVPVTGVTSLTTVYVIARVEATTTSGRTLRDWIPLRGTVLVSSTCL